MEKCVVPSVIFSLPPTASRTKSKLHVTCTVTLQLHAVASVSPFESTFKLSRIKPTLSLTLDSTLEEPLSLPTPPLVLGAFQHATSAQVASLPTALVHLHMDNLKVGHAQANMMDCYFQPYFDKDNYYFSHLSFNLATEESMRTYERTAIDLTHSLSSFTRVVIFLITHNNEERGDLFSGHIDKKPIASKVSECLQVLFNPLTKLVQNADIIFNVCGSVVTQQESFNDLKEVAAKFKPRSMILFDAQRLQLGSTTSYLLSLLDSVIVQGFHVAQAAKSGKGGKGGGGETNVD
ncbi:hypothetical protein EDD17DRAFT_1764414 [Pisolithus thermaeus]|nr:hypothetical protein EDD17DRAFT_1764414 [Pisolithus thermaeus]